MKKILTFAGVFALGALIAVLIFATVRPLRAADASPLENKAGVFYFPDTIDIQNVQYEQSEGIVKVTGVNKASGAAFLIIYKWGTSTPYSTISLVPKPVDQIYR